MILHPIYYTIKALSVYQKNYTMTKHEFHEVVFALEKFQCYFLGTKVIVHTNDYKVCKIEVHQMGVNAA